MTGQPSSSRQGHRSKEVADQGAEGRERFQHLLGGSPETQTVLKPPWVPRFLSFFIS